MKRTAIAALVLFACAAPPASADLGMTMTMSMNAGGMVLNATMETRLKASKMRADVKMMQQDMSVFFDAAAKQVWMANHATREITTPDPAAMAEAGIPLAQEFHVAMEGAGQAAAALAQFGNMTLVTTVTGLSTDPIADEVFALPAGYTKR